MYILFDEDSQKVHTHTHTNKLVTRFMEHLFGIEIDREEGSIYSAGKEKKKPQTRKLAN